MTTLKTFINTGGPYYPTGPLIEAKNGKLYGTSEAGSPVCCGNGTIYNVTLKGKVSAFYNFNATNAVQSPDGGVIQGTDGSFYGITTRGGQYDEGSIYQVSQAGVLTDLHDVSFANDGSGYPSFGLLQATDGNFYGTLTGCASGGCQAGALFEITSGELEIAPTGTLAIKNDGVLRLASFAIDGGLLVNVGDGTSAGTLGRGVSSQVSARSVRTSTSRTLVRYCSSRPRSSCPSFLPSSWASSSTASRMLPRRLSPRRCLAMPPAGSSNSSRNTTAGLP